MSRTQLEEGEGMRREFDLGKCFQCDNMEEKETGRAGDGKSNTEGGRQMEGEGGWNHLSREELSEELDCMPLAGVIVKAL